MAVFTVCLPSPRLTRVLPLCPSACVLEQLETAAFFSESIPKSRVFVTVHDAVLHILKKKKEQQSDCSTVVGHLGVTSLVFTHRSVLSTV